MGLRPYYLGDTSAWARLGQSQVAARLVPLRESGLVARCTPTDLEPAFSSERPGRHLAMREMRSAWPLVAAVTVQDALAERSWQRGARIADLLIAAAAEAARIVVLHYDHDFDLIAEVTEPSTEWIVPAGSVS